MKINTNKVYYCKYCGKAIRTSKKEKIKFQYENKELSFHNWCNALNKNFKLELK